MFPIIHSKVVRQSGHKFLLPSAPRSWAISGRYPLLCAVVMLSNVKTSNQLGDRMAIIQIEDLTGQTEAAVFPKV